MFDLGPLYHYCGRYVVSSLYLLTTTHCSTRQMSVIMIISPVLNLLLTRETKDTIRGSEEKSRKEAAVDIYYLLYAVQEIVSYCTRW